MQVLLAINIVASSNSLHHHMRLAIWYAVALQSIGLKYYSDLSSSPSPRRTSGEFDAKDGRLVHINSFGCYSAASSSILLSETALLHPASTLSAARRTMRVQKFERVLRSSGLQRALAHVELSKLNADSWHPS